MAAKSPTRSKRPSTPASTPSWKNWPLAAKLRLLHRLQTEAWARTARTEQRQPEGSWRTWYVAGGRGSGKTRTGSETFADWILGSPPGEWAIVAPTYAAARDVCVEGPGSGLLEVLGGAVEQWNRSLGELRVANGAKVHIDGADDGALRIQGKNLRGAWCDEVGLWKRWQVAWEESIRFAVRLDPGRIIATGTPKGNRALPKLLVEDDAVPVSRLRTADNRENLSPALLAEWEELYGGTRLGQQELEGLLLDDVEGALWRYELIEAHRVDEAPDDLTVVVVGIDPEASSTARSAETGIVVAGLDSIGEFYVLGDYSLRASPNQWAARSLFAYGDWRADRLVPEKNNGGEMVENTIRTLNRDVKIKPVWASRGKKTRAEPISALYEQGRVHHVGTFPELEAQLCGWVPGSGDESPDRLDALVWALSDLKSSRKKRTVRLKTAR